MKRDGIHRRRHCDRPRRREGLSKARAILGVGICPIVDTPAFATLAASLKKTRTPAMRVTASAN